MRTEAATGRRPARRWGAGALVAIAAALAIILPLAGEAELRRAGRERAGRERAGRERAGERAARERATSEITVLLAEGRGQRRISSLSVDGDEYLASADIIDILRATSYWRSETRKLLLRVGEHRVTLAVDNPFVLVDGRVLRLPAGPLLRAGQVWAPAALFDLLARAEVTPGASWDADRRLLALGAGEGLIGDLAFRAGQGRTTLVIPVAEGVTPSIVSAVPRLLVVRLRGAVPSPETLGEKDAAGRFLRVELIASPGGVDLELEVSELCQGYLVRRLADPSRVEVIAADEAGRQGDLVLLPLGPAGTAGAVPGLPGVPGRPAFVVLDPGHGGEDEGSRSPGGKLEKHLSLELAKRVKRHLEQGAGFRVMLVRERDERVDVPRRVEIANGTGADLLLSLHVDLEADGSPSRRRRGFRIAVRDGGGQVLYEDLGTLVPGAVAASDVGEGLSLVRWETVGAEHGFESQRLAQNVAAALADKFPREGAQVMRWPVWNLEGANMPAVLVELVAPGSGGSDQAMGSGETLESLARAVASGVVAHWSGERPETDRESRRETDRER